MGAGTAIVLFVIYQVVISPYLDSLSDIEKQTNAGLTQQKAIQALFDKQGRLQVVWKDITSNLKTDDSEAESQALNDALDWAQAAGVNITSVRPERTSTVNEFQVIGFHLTGNGTTPAIGKMMAAFETAKIPLRVDEMILAPVKEGTDNLKIDLTLSTLSVKPPPNSAVVPAVSSASGT
jgi:hypothetical protein